MKTEVGRAIIQVLNEGYHKEGVVRRASGEGYKIECFNVYCPKLWNSRKMPEGSFLSRSIPHISIKNPFKPSILTEEFYKQSLEIKNKLLWYRIKHFSDEIIWNEEFEKLMIEPRLKEITKAMVSMIPNPDTVKVIEEINSRIKGQEETYFKRTVLLAVLHLYHLKQPLSCTKIAETVRTHEHMTDDETDKDFFSPDKCGRILRGSLYFDLTRIRDVKNVRKGISLTAQNMDIIKKTVKAFNLTEKDVDDFTIEFFQVLKERKKPESQKEAFPL